MRINFGNKYVIATMNQDREIFTFCLANKMREGGLEVYSYTEAKKMKHIFEYAGHHFARFIVFVEDEGVTIIDCHDRSREKVSDDEACNSTIETKFMNVHCFI